MREDCGLAFSARHPPRPLLTRTRGHIAPTELVQQGLVGFQLQDLECDRCGTIKADNMALSCPCSGVYRDKISVPSFTLKMKIFDNIASFHKVRVRALGRVRSVQ